MSSDGTERKGIEEAVKPCPNCNGEITRLNVLEVWLCDQDPDHCWPADEWSVAPDNDQEDDQ